MAKSGRKWLANLTFSRLLGTGLLLVWLGSHLVLLRFVYVRWVKGLEHPQWQKEDVVIDRFSRTFRKSRYYKTSRTYVKRRIWTHPAHWLKTNKPKIMGFRQYNASPFEWIAFQPFSTEAASKVQAQHNQLKFQIAKWAEVTKYTEPQLFQLKGKQVLVSRWEGRVYRSLSPPVKVQGIVVTPIEKDTAIHIISASRVRYARTVEQVALHLSYTTRTVVKEISPYSFRRRKNTK